jgi:DNA gyrase subunit A
MTLNLKDLIHHYVEHRHEVVIRRTKFELEQAEKRAHILEGLLIALDHLDAVISLIRNSNTPEEAKNGLMANFGLSEIQAKAILDLRLQKLTGLEREGIKQEHAELMKQIEYLRSILADEALRMNIIKGELLELKEKYGDERRSEIVYSADDLKIEDMIADETVVITISHMGYIKRTSLDEYKVQSRGGRGSRGSATRDEDFLEHIFVATAHNYMLFFTEQGKCYWLRVFEIPEGNKTSKGRPIQNLINIAQDDKIKAYINVKDLNDEAYVNNNYIIMCTQKGTIKKTTLEAYSRPRQNGINAINVREGDMLLEVKLTSGKDEVMLASKSGKLVRFNESNVRPMGRTATGVRGINLSSDNDEVIGMVTVNDPSQTILVVSENGYGKRSEVEEYRVTNRGAKGVKTINITEKTGQLIAIKNVTDEDDLMIINKSGIVLRMAIKDIRVMGRNTQGVRLINLKDNDSIAAVTVVPKDEEEEVVKPDGEILEGTVDNGTDFEDNNDTNEESTEETN